MPTATATTPTDSIKRIYANLERNVAAARETLGRPLTLAEKILFAHLAKPPASDFERGSSYVDLLPDRIAMQDATAQMALLQFLTAGLPEVAVPTTVHCDHLIQAKSGASEDLHVAEDANREVYDFLKQVSAKHGIGFWGPGSGIIHQVVLEQYAFPGGMMIGTDSHTPNAGGLGMIAIGVGGADAVDVMVGQPFNVRLPKLIGVHLKGSPSGWTSPKDVILKVAQVLTVKGGTGAVIEYFGDGARSLSATGKATICNMGAEIGATCSLFSADDHTVAYLRSSGRGEVAALVAANLPLLGIDPEVEAAPAAYFDQVIEIDLDELEPQIVGPATPDLGRGTGDIGAEAEEKGWPVDLSYCLVGSCTNSSYEDISRAASIARWARGRGLRVRTPLLVTPGSERTRATIERDGLLEELTSIGATVLANACGPCIGQWNRSDTEVGTLNSILTSYNRNFPKRNDGNPATQAFIASPEVVVAYALAGTFDFNPITDELDGMKIPAPRGEELPPAGLALTERGFAAPQAAPADRSIAVNPNSDRLQLLTPFETWDGSDMEGLPVLMKAVGKCTTDHISAAGPWLRYRGHLENISNNLFLGVNNAFASETGHGWCQIHREIEQLSEIARHYKAERIGWVAIGDENYGEGSSREHAAMEPRYLGGRAIIARSYARIAEANLKKQGVLPLTFADRGTYDKIEKDDTIDILGLADIAPNREIAGRIHHGDGSIEEFELRHTLSPLHIEWFKAGSALNLIRARAR